jgi:hypothetical protein
MKTLIDTSRQKDQSLLPRVQQLDQSLPRVVPPDTTLPRVEPPGSSLPRVEPFVSENQQITHTIAQQMSTTSLPAHFQSTLPLRMRKKKLRPPVIAPSRTPLSAPAMNTGSQTADKAKLAASPAANTRARQSNLRQLTTPAMNLRKRITGVQNKVHRALVVMDKATGKMLNYRQLLRHPTYNSDWTLSSANEFGWLANGVGGRVTGTNTIKFIPKSAIPKDRRKDVTYGSFVCTVRPEKKEPNRTRFVVGGDRINYPGKVATPTADMLVAKILLNSVISTPGAQFMTLDTSNFYLNTPLARPEYIRLNIRDIPKEIIVEYNLKDIVEKDGSILLEANKGMYGLPHDRLIANELLENRLNKAGYFQSKYVPGLWSHKTRPIAFTLVVDNFGVKYIGKEHALHLKSFIEEHYKCSADWSDNRYIGITIDWEYANRKVHLSMPGYKDKALKQIQHHKPSTPQHLPFQCKETKYGAK